MHASYALAPLGIFLRTPAQALIPLPQLLPLLFDRQPDVRAVAAPWVGCLAASQVATSVSTAGRVSADPSFQLMEGIERVLGVGRAASEGPPLHTQQQVSGMGSH